MMKLLYRRKTINYGFIVICPNFNIKQAKKTINSIKNNYQTDKCICVLPNECSVDDMREINKLCHIVKAGNDVASLINNGMNDAICNEWNFIITSGTWVKGLLDRKYSCFVESEKDILFPIINRQTSFVNSSINGVMLHKKTWKEVGCFSQNKSFEVCKLLWTSTAIEKGITFKAILGTTMS